MANSLTHGNLPYPVKGAKLTLTVSWRSPAGHLVDPTTPAATKSLDAGAYVACTNTPTLDGSGIGHITLTGDETNSSRIRLLLSDSAGSPAVFETAAVINPRILATSRDGAQTATGGGSNWIQADLFADAIDYRGCIVKTTGGTGGGGGSGSRDNQARVIIDIIGDKAYVDPPWETTPNATTTFVVLITEADKSTMWTGADLDGYTPVEAMRVMLAAAGGTVAGANDDPLTNKTIIISAIDGSKPRIEALCDPFGNRLLITIDATR